MTLWSVEKTYFRMNDVGLGMDVLEFHGQFLAFHSQPQWASVSFGVDSRARALARLRSAQRVVLLLRQHGEQRPHLVVVDAAVLGAADLERRRSPWPGTRGG